MKILFTGASSHTGYWFVTELIKAGHEVGIILQNHPNSYEGIRRERVDELIKIATPFYGVSFGDPKFIEIVKSSSWNILCHHAAIVTNYRSFSFDALYALKQNVNNLPAVLDALKKGGCNHILISGSVSEQNEGTGTMPLEAFTPYHLSKGLTWDFFKFYVVKKQMSLGKFVLPNPFGPMEDPKFTTYVVQSWFKREVPIVKTPSYIRDNIHVTLLAKAYRVFVEDLLKLKSPDVMKTNPSQYKGTQGDFAKRFRDEMAPRLGIECKLEFTNQTEFPEPIERVNFTELDINKLEWTEKRAWDDLATFYLSHYSK